MANKPSPRNWKDVQTMFATTSMALTLALWNHFAGPDREAAEKRAQEEAEAAAALALQTVEAQPIVEAAPELPTGPIFLGGSAPQTKVIVQTSGNNGGGGGGGGGNGGGGNGGGGGAPVTSTSSS